MFEVIKLKRRIKSIERSYAKERDKLKNAKASQDDLGQLESSEFYAVRELDKEIDQIVGLRLSHEARSLDVETPPITDTEMWDEEFGRRWFTSKGRAQVRKLIHEEKTRRFEAKSRWIPLLSVLLGIISTSTALVALLQQRKSVDAATTAAGTARIGVELARKQLVGTLGAVVVFMPNYSANVINPVLENRGHVISRNAHISFEWGIAPLNSLDTSIQQGTYSHTFPQLVVGGSVEPLNIGISLGQEFSMQRYTVKIEGTYDYDNGFEDRISENFCYFYLAHYRASMEDGGVESGGPGFWPCSNFAQKVRYVRTHHLR
jgi:hypothetical protein